MTMTIQLSSLPKRPKVLPSKTIKTETGYGTIYVTITELEEGKPYEIFTSIGKGGSTTKAKAEAIGRLASLALRHGVDVKEVIKALIDISGSRPYATGKELIKSIPDAIAKTLKSVYGGENDLRKETKTDEEGSFNE